MILLFDLIDVGIVNWPSSTEIDIVFVNGPSNSEIEVGVVN